MYETDKNGEMQIVGQVGITIVGDRVNKQITVVICMGVHAAGLLLLAYAENMAMVIGPTPPGTGVIAVASFDTSRKSTSPTKPESV